MSLALSSTLPRLTPLRERGPVPTPRGMPSALSSAAAHTTPCAAVQESRSRARAHLTRCLAQNLDRSVGIAASRSRCSKDLPLPSGVARLHTRPSEGPSSPSHQVDENVWGERTARSAIRHGSSGRSAGIRVHGVGTVGGMWRMVDHGRRATSGVLAKSQQRGRSVDPASTSKVARSGSSRRPLASDSLAVPVIPYRLTHVCGSLHETWAHTQHSQEGHSSTFLTMWPHIQT